MTSRSLPIETTEFAPQLARRKMLAALAGLGIGTAVFHGALAASALTAEVTAEMVEQAEWISGLELTEEDRQKTAQHLKRVQARLDDLRKVHVNYDVAPALTLMPLAPSSLLAARGDHRQPVEPLESHVVKRPENDEDLAFMPISELGALIRRRQISSTQLTKIYLERLRNFDPKLTFLVTLTEEVALRQSEKADREIAAGRYRGPLHGVPWGAKDLIAYPGYKTTWGATPFQDQTLDYKATVAQRLEDAGAVLLAKLSLGALAQGDRWFRGMTKNPWDVTQGSSGSSAGSASATAAGCVGFSLGSETLGSIVSPCRRCGTTGLRPTFGRVSRDGCMTLAWSMDKIGPICRSVEDCALVFDAIRGSDGKDQSVRDAPFHWPHHGHLHDLRVGYFENGKSLEERRELKILRDLGVALRPIELPNKIPAGALTIILDVETATAFDDITRDGITEGLNSWPQTFRRGRFVSAVDYLRANRVRSLLMKQMAELFEDIDMYVDTSARDLVITNMTGHPTVVMPLGFQKANEAERPYSITFTGQLFEESKLLAVAHAFQQATDAHLKRPPL